MSTITPCTSSSRPTASTGRIAFETDTNNIIVYDGSAWRGYQNDEIRTSVTNAYYFAFDGVDDDLIATTYDAGNVGTTGSLSISGWLRVPSAQLGSYTQVFYFGDSVGNSNWMGVNVQTNDTLRLFFRKGTGTDLSVASTNTILADTWYSFVAVRSYSGTTCTGTLYVNGTQWATGSASNHDYEIGSLTKFAGNGSVVHRSDQDEMAIYESALDLSHSKIVHNGGTPGDISSLNPVAWYRCGDGTEAGSGNTVYDMSGSATTYNATRNGAAYTAY